MLVRLKHPCCWGPTPSELRVLSEPLGKVNLEKYMFQKYIISYIYIYIVPHSLMAPGSSLEPNLRRPRSFWGGILPSVLRKIFGTQYYVG